jgi:hypothetical protein
MLKGLIGLICSELNRSTDHNAYNIPKPCHDFRTSTPLRGPIVTARRVTATSCLWKNCPTKMIAVSDNCASLLRFPNDLITTTDSNTVADILLSDTVQKIRWRGPANDGDRLAGCLDVNQP